MKLLVKVRALSASRSCSAVSSNHILFVFPVSDGDEIRLGHVIEVDPFIRDKVQVATNQSTGKNIGLVLLDHNIHDLLLPVRHGASRTPSDARLCKTDEQG